MRRLARLAALLLPHWQLVLLGIGLSLAALLANVALLALSSWFLASMAIAGAAGTAMEYNVPAAAVRGLAIARAGGRYLERLVNHNTTFRILTTLRVWVFGRLETLSPARLGGMRSGDLLSRVRADVDALDDFYVRGVVPAASALLGMACFAAFLARYDQRLAWIDVAGLTVAGLAAPLLIRLGARRPGAERVEIAAGLRASVVEQTQGMAELIALGAVESAEARIAVASLELDRRKRRLESLQGLGDACCAGASSLAVWATALVLAQAVSGGSLPRAHMAMLTAFVLASFEAVLPLPAVFQRTGELSAAARRLFELIDTPPAVPDPGTPAPDAGAVAAAPCLGLIVRGLRFRYGADRSPALDGVSFGVPAGGRLGLTGPTGAGKSTLVSLLLRFWEYEEGSIVLTDAEGREHDLRARSGDEVRALFAVVPQSPHLFHTTLRENLELAAPDRAGPMAPHELAAALAASGLDDLVSRLPEGLETVVGEAGRKLSAGEVKRVAIARALLKPAPILLLDEPTEGLDDRAAGAVLAALDRVARGRTLIVLSHRAQDLALAPRVVELSLPA